MFVAVGSKTTDTLGLCTVSDRVGTQSVAEVAEWLQSEETSPGTLLFLKNTGGVCGCVGLVARGTKCAFVG